MILTEAEATGMECPLGFNTDDNRPCRASNCPMWQMYDPADSDNPNTYANKPRRGYCGLAGKPEMII